MDFLDGFEMEFSHAQSFVSEIIPDFGMLYNVRNKKMNISFRLQC